MVKSKQKKTNSNIMEKLKKEFIIISKPDDLSNSVRDVSQKADILSEILVSIFDELSALQYVEGDLLEDLKFLITDYIGGRDSWSDDGIFSDELCNLD